MIRKQRAIRLASLLFAILWGSAAQAQYLLTNPTAPAFRPSGAQLQIGTGLPVPVGTAGIFQGGMSVGDAANFPKLNILPQTDIPSIGATPPGPVKTLMQAFNTAMGGDISIPAELLTHMADGTPSYIGVINTNPVVFQVATTVDFQWPDVPANFVVGAAPVGGFAGPGPGTVTYSMGAKAFGGPALFAIQPGPGAGGFAIQAVGTKIPIATVFLFVPAAGSPYAPMTVSLIGASFPLGKAAQGQSVAAASFATNFPAVPYGVRTINSPMGGMFNTPLPNCTKWCAGPNGTFDFTPSGLTWDVGSGTSTIGMMGLGATNKATSTKGFPWATGSININAYNAVPAEQFFVKGTDMRVAGVGNLSLVSSALSRRMLSGPNANRGWLSLNLPEPTAALGALGAFGLLALLHGVMRRRSN